MKIEPMRPDDFDAITTWRYEPPYDFYDDDGEEARLNPERYFAVRDEEDDLIGFYYYEGKPDALEYGLGLRPDLTGRGFGLEFFRAGLAFGRERYRPPFVRLFVAAFNERAIKVYERAGFRETGRHMRSFERFGDVEFVNMEEEH